MASSKLSGRRYRGSYPPYCLTSPLPGPVIPPGSPGNTLQTFARWTDLDPLAPGDQSRLFTLARVGPGNTYFGQSFPSGDRLTLLVAQIGTEYYWDFTLEIWDVYRTPETFTWSNVFVNLHQPFDSHLLQDIILPKLDYRYVHTYN